MTPYLQVPSVITAIRTMADGTVRLTVDAQELASEEVAQLFEALNCPINFLIVTGDVNGVQPKTTPRKPPAKSGAQTHSQRLRDSLWRRYQTLPGGERSFEEYYAYRMELIIEQAAKR